MIPTGGTGVSPCVNAPAASSLAGHVIGKGQRIAMKILVIGASRGIGLETVRRALERGHEVRAMARGAEKMGLEDPRLEKFPGDATDAADVARALEGVDAVIQALGVPHGPRLVLGPIDLFSKATRVLVAEMQRAGVRRLVSVTGFGTGESRAKVSFLERIPHWLVLGRVYADKDVQERIIRESGLDWVIARPVVLTDGKRTGRHRVLLASEAWRNGLISRADVADFLVAQAEEPSCLRQCPVLAY